MFNVQPVLQEPLSVLSITALTQDHLHSISAMKGNACNAHKPLNKATIQNMWLYRLLWYSFNKLLLAFLLYLHCRGPNQKNDFPRIWYFRMVFGTFLSPDAKSTLRSVFCPSSFGVVQIDVLMVLGWLGSLVRFVQQSSCKKVEM